MTTLLSRSTIDDDPAGGTRARGSPVASKGQVPAELLIVTQWCRPELIGTAFYIAGTARVVRQSRQQGGRPHEPTKLPG